MQFLIIVALIVALLAWVANVYHQLAQLHQLSMQHWRRSELCLRERNAALREFTYLVSIHESGQDLLLRELRRVQGDLDFELSHHDVVKVESVERRLQGLLERLSAQLADGDALACNSSLQQAEQLLLYHQGVCNSSVALYNESAARYNFSLKGGSHQFIGGLFHFKPAPLLNEKELEVSL